MAGQNNLASPAICLSLVDASCQWSAFGLYLGLTMERQDAADQKLHRVAISKGWFL